VASKHPELVSKLQEIYNAHVADLKAHQRPSQFMKRAEEALSPARPKKKTK